MVDVFDELNEINAQVVIKDGKIQRINFRPFLDTLYDRVSTKPILRTRNILEFMSSLQGKNKSSSKNGISRLQTFLYFYTQEIALKTLNSSLKFINDDHDFLKRGGHGEDDAEFYFTASDGTVFKLEAKMYWDEKSFRENVSATNFHNADYVCLFFLKDQKYRWAFAKKEDNYEKIYRAVDLAETDPQILELRMPNILTTISFNVDKDSKDSDIPEEIGYRRYNN